MAVGPAMAQGQRGRTPVLNLPHGPVQRLASPDGAYLLYGVSLQSAPELWMENLRTGHRNLLLSIGSTLSAAWSADSTAFYVNDHWASDSTRSYIYDGATLQRLDIAERVLAADPGAKRFAEGHAYFDVERWQGTESVMVHFYGHTDDAPVVCFDLRYQVSRSGAVSKLSQRVLPIGTHACPG
jgi:hypothetical protein